MQQMSGSKLTPQLLASMGVSGNVKHTFMRSSGIGCGRARNVMDSAVDTENGDQAAFGLDFDALDMSDQPDLDLMAEDFIDEPGYVAPRPTMDFGRMSGRYTGGRLTFQGTSDEPTNIKRISFSALQSTQKGRDSVNRFFGSFNSRNSHADHEARHSFDDLAEEAGFDDMCLSEEPSGSGIFGDFENSEMDPLPSLLGRQRSHPLEAKVSSMSIGENSIKSSLHEVSKKGVETFPVRSTASHAVTTSATSATFPKALVSDQPSSSTCDVAATMPRSPGQFSEEGVRIGEHDDCATEEEKEPSAFLIRSPIVDESLPCARDVTLMMPLSEGQNTKEGERTGEHDDCLTEVDVGRTAADASANLFEPASSKSVQESCQPEPPAAPMPKKPRPRSAALGRTAKKPEATAKVEKKPVPRQVSFCTDQVAYIPQSPTSPKPPVPRRRPFNANDDIVPVPRGLDEGLGDNAAEIAATKENPQDSSASGVLKEIPPDSSAPLVFKEQHDRADSAEKKYSKIEHRCRVDLTPKGIIAVNITTLHFQSEVAVSELPWRIPVTNCEHIAAAEDLQEASLCYTSGEDE